MSEKNEKRLKAVKTIYGKEAFEKGLKIKYGKFYFYFMYFPLTLYLALYNDQTTTRFLDLKAGSCFKIKNNMTKIQLTKQG